MGLVASNTDQLLTVITSKPELNGLDIAKIILISLSLTVQVSEIFFKMQNLFRQCFYVTNYENLSGRSKINILFQIVLMLTLAWIGILKPILSYPAESAKEAKLEKDSCMYAFPSFYFFHSIILSYHFKG